MSKVNPGIFPHMVLKSALKDKANTLLKFSNSFQITFYILVLTNIFYITHNDILISIIFTRYYQLLPEADSSHSLSLLPSLTF